MELTTLAIFLSVFVANVVGLTNFTQPPASGPDANYQDNPVYQEGQKIDVQWRTNLDTFDLLLFQQYPSPGKGVQYLKKLRLDTRSTSLIWTVSLSGLSRKVAKGEDAILYFAVMPAKSPNKDAMSHYFNVTIADAPTTTSASDTASVSTISMATTSMTVVPSNTTTPPPENSGGSSPGLSNGAVAGIAVGCTIGGLLLLGGIGLLLWKKMKKSKAADETQETQESEVKKEPLELSGPAIHEAPTNTPSQHHQPHPPNAPIYEAP